MMSSCPLKAWLGRGNLGNEMSEDISKFCQILPLFCQRRKSKAFSGAASVKVPGHRPEGGWILALLFLFLLQSNIFSKVYSGYQNYSQIFWNIFTKKYLFLHRHSLKKKKSLEKSKWNLFFPSSSLSSELKKINYMLILSHRSEKPHWALMELTLFLNFQLCTRSSISVTPACVSSHQEHLHHHSKGKLPPILSCIHQH